MREGDLFNDRGEYLEFDFNAACGYGLGGMTVGAAQSFGRMRSLPTR
jgi:hypothetical protein